MSPELIGIAVGIGVVVPTIYFIRKREFDSRVWPVFLFTLPVYYMLFGLLAMNGTVILNELLFGLPYIATGLIVWRIKSRLSLYLIAIAWLSHGFYDYYHDLLFVNPGVFSWYPAFCAVVDLAVGGYLLADSKRLTQSFKTHSSEKLPE